MKSHKAVMLAILLIALAVAAGLSRTGKTKPPENTESALPRVTLVPISDYRTDTTSVHGSGNVESLSQADLRSQVSSPVARILVSVGERVEAGQTLVILKNEDIGAQVSQARAALAMQEALLSQAQTGTRPEALAIQRSAVEKATHDLESLYVSAGSALSDAYAKADDAIRTRVSALYQNGYSNSPTLTFVTSDPQASVDLVNQRIAVNLDMSAWKDEMDRIGSDGSRDTINAALAAAPERLSHIGALLTTALRAVENAPGLPPALQDGYKANIALARGNVSMAQNSLNTISTQISGANIGLSQAKDQLALLQAGSTADQINAQKAAVEQARAALGNAQTQYGKTVITAPIAGTIAAIPARLNELQSPGQIIVSIVNKGGQQVKAYVSGEDASRIENGADAIINGSIKGKVVRIAPSIDPNTKMVEVDVLVSDPRGNLVVGDTAQTAIVTKQAAQPGTYFLPVQAVRIGAGGSASVMTVGSTSRISLLPVTLGSVRGEFIEVTGGLSPDLSIVSSVYERREGEIVDAR